MNPADDNNSRQCTLSAKGFLKESMKLKKLEIHPIGALFLNIIIHLLYPSHPKYRHRPKIYFMNNLLRNIFNTATSPADYKFTFFARAGLTFETIISQRACLDG